MEIMEVPLILFTGHIYVFLSTEIKNRIKKNRFSLWGDGKFDI